MGPATVGVVGRILVENRRADRQGGETVDNPHVQMGRYARGGEEAAGLLVLTEHVGARHESDEQRRALWVRDDRLAQRHRLDDQVIGPVCVRRHGGGVLRCRDRTRYRRQRGVLVGEGRRHRSA